MMLRYGSPMAVAAPVTTLVARRYSWSITDKCGLQIIAAAKAWRGMKKNSDIRRVRGTCLTCASCWIFSLCTTGLHTTG
jgi:hypothetical protein